MFYIRLCSLQEWCFLACTRVRKKKSWSYIKKVLQYQFNLIGKISHIEKNCFEIILFIKEMSKVVSNDDVLYVVAVLSGGSSSEVANCSKSHRFTPWRHSFLIYMHITPNTEYNWLLLWFCIPFLVYFMILLSVIAHNEKPLLCPTAKIK